MESTKVATYADAPTVQTTMGTGACVITQKENSMANNGTQTVEQPTIQQIVDAAAQAPQVAAAKPPKPEPVFVLTPYQGTKLVNQALAEAGVVDKDDPSKPASVNSPMMYIYAKKGAFKYHKATKVTKKGTSADVWELDIETFKAWVEEYVTSRVAKQAKGEMDAEMADIEPVEASDVEPTEEDLETEVDDEVEEDLDDENGDEIDELDDELEVDEAE